MLAFWLVVAPSGPGRAAQPKPFPALTIVSGFAPGGGDAHGGGAGRGGVLSVRPRPVYDLTARLYVRHFSRFLPGQPDIVLRHMPGGGSIRAARWLLARTRADGAVAGVVSGHALRQMILSAGARHGLDRVHPVGGLYAGEYVCAHRAMPEGRQKAAFGATAPPEASFLYARAFAPISPFDVKIVSGYANTSQIALAFRRREIDGFCGLALATVMSQLGDEMQAGQLVPLVRFAAPGAGSMLQIPLASAYRTGRHNRATSEAERAALTFLQWQGVIDAALLAQPAMTRDHLHALRTAYRAMTGDADFRRDAVRWGLQVDPVRAGAIGRAIRQMSTLAAGAAPLLQKWSRNDDAGGRR